MKYVISVLFGDRLFHTSMSEGKQVEISSSSHADIFISQFGHSVVVKAERGNIYISYTTGDGSEKKKNIPLNLPYVVDTMHRVAICVSKEQKCDSVAWLGERFNISLGRVTKGKIGKINDIVLPDVPFVSRTQMEIVRNNGRTILRDLNSTNGTFVNGSRVNETELNYGDEISILTVRILYDEDCLRFENIGAEPTLADFLRARPYVEFSGKELFKRCPRIQEQVPEGKIEIPAPPARLSKPEINWISTLLPAGVTIGLAVTMALVFNNMMMMFYSLPMTLAGVVVSIVNYLRGDKKYKSGLEERRTAYLKKLDEVKAEIAEKRKAQKKAMLMADPSPEACLAAVRSRSAMLWCREPNDIDFVSVRLGTGSIPFSVVLNKPREQLIEDDDLQKRPGEIYRDSITIEDMPVLCDIRSSGVVGLLGEMEATRTQLQNMVLHLATHHSYTELKLICFYNEEDREELSWLEDLPHTHGEDQEDRYLASTQEEADSLFRLFTKVLKQRKQEAQENCNYGSEPLFVPYLLFIFFEPKLLKKTDQINQYLFMEHGLSAGCLMAVQKISQLPKQCTEIVTISDNRGEIYNTSRASERQSFQMDVVSPEIRRMFGHSMHPLYCDEGIATSSLPKGYSLYQMLGIDAIGAYDIGKHWRSSDILTSKLAPSAPIGILENGEEIYFNSPPTSDNGGAHALVAGTTGSGKSEVLLTLLLSLALRYPPDEVGFLVVDFKGDSVAGKLTGLPHLRGVITNLDGDELRRSLVSIGSENKKRLRLFKEYNDSHPEDKKKISNIREYTEKYRQGKVAEPLPHLFIVVDEFAEMKKQLPDVMDQFLSVAQIGRSLGVHLILATQSPSGVVDNKIRANILKQLCLKVANTGESRDVIGADLAARIKDPGRGYLKVDDSIQLFQSAYGGGNLRLPDGSESTQLREASDAIIAYCHTHNIQKLPDIFCPPLPARVPCLELSRADSEIRPFGQLPIGLRDDPAIQFVGEYSLDAFSRNTIIVGSQLTGKTNLLQTILRGVAEMYSPEEVNVYILEFASLFLKNYETLPHVGGVVTPQETEKITNLFRLLKDQMELRRQKFMSLGVSTFSAYRESGACDLPQILILVDDIAAAKAHFPPDEDPLLSLCKEGLTLGISVVATATQPVGGMSYLPTFGNRIALYNNDVSVYNTLLGHTSLRPKELPGRCLVSWDNTIYECQSFLAFDSEREIDRAENIRAFCRKQIAESNGKTAVSIPLVPKDLSASDVFSTYAKEFKCGRLVFGLDYATVRPLSAKIEALGLFAVSGRERDVRNFQRYIITSAEKANGFKAELYVVDGIDKGLLPLSGLSCVAEYSFIPEQTTQMLRVIQRKAEERYVRVAQGDISFLDTSPTLVLMLNSSEAIASISSDKIALEAWKAITGKLKSMNICIIFGALDNVSIPYGSEVLKKIKEDRKLVFFDNIENLKIAELPYATVKKFTGPLKKGDGYMIIGNETARIRVPDCPPI